MSSSDEDEEKEAFLTINDIPVYFSEDWDTGIGGGLWSTGLAMAKYFRHHSTDVINDLKRLAHLKHMRWYRQLTNEQQKLYRTGEGARDRISRGEKGISALELGSGNGFLSVCLLALCAYQNVPLVNLVVTDMSDHLQLMYKSIKKNLHVCDMVKLIDPFDDIDCEHECEFGHLSECYPDNLPKDRQQTCDTEIIITEHQWGKFKGQDGYSDFPPDDHHLNIHNKKFDFIFGTDLAYRNSLHDPLISSLLHFSHDQTVCLLGVTMTDTQPVFFDKLTAAGFKYEKLADHLLQKEFRNDSFGIFAIQRRKIINC